MDFPLNILAYLYPQLSELTIYHIILTHHAYNFFLREDLE
jgi:hypothetical protein